MKTQKSLLFAAPFLLFCVQAAVAIEPHGFAETRAGLRTGSDPSQGDETLGELRVQLDGQHHFETASVQVRADLLYDWALNDHDVDLETGAGWLDLREANIQLYPAQSIDLKIGRQILTWGNGDLVFINDLFPKDWPSLLLGRDEEYLKAPSDALFASAFHEWGNLDVAYMPRFDADRYLSGQRVSFYNPQPDSIGAVDPVRPDDPFSDDELSLRFSRTVGGYELAAYGYDGFWKSPAGVAPDSGRPTFPALRVYGASARGQLGQGIAVLEGGYYDSHDDASGDDPYVQNSEARTLVGYERELGRDFTAAAQYYLEHMLEYGGYVSGLPAGAPARDEDRHVLTLRLTKMLLGQNLRVSLFTFYSPSDQDAYLRPAAHYKVSDHLAVSGGANLFIGKEDHTFFGQFEENNNVYAALRYSL